MELQKVISLVTQAGAVVLTTVTSFIITPPVLNPGSQAVDWHNVSVFVIGVFSVVVSNQEWPKVSHKQLSIGIVLLLTLLTSIVVYQIIYIHNTTSCHDEVVCVTGSISKLRPEVKQDFAGWAGAADPIRSFVEAYQCEPLKLWTFSTLATTYYALVAIYLVISGLVTTTLLFVSKHFLKTS